jgi:hypothetical protein
MPSPSKKIVGALIFLALTAVAFIVAGWKVGLFLLALIIYEAWTFINPYPNDTISETIWEFCKQPFVPWIFGVGTGWAIQSGFFGNDWMLAAMLFLQGHFFSQSYSVYNKK